MPWFLLRALQRTARIFVLRFAPGWISWALCWIPRRTGRIHAQEAVISAAYSKVKVMVIPTNEELVVAREVRRFFGKQKNNLTESKQSYFMAHQAIGLLETRGLVALVGGNGRDVKGG